MDSKKLSRILERWGWIIFAVFLTLVVAVPVVWIGDIGGAVGKIGVLTLLVLVGVAMIVLGRSRNGKW